MSGAERRRLAAAALAGLPIAGGCDDCTAYLRLVPLVPGVLVPRVYHDRTCPAYWRLARAVASPQPPEDSTS